jgi:hypothetical protein
MTAALWTAEAKLPLFPKSAESARTTTWPLRDMTRVSDSRDRVPRFPSPPSPTWDRTRVRAAAGQETRVRIGVFDAVLSPAFTAAVTTRLSASVKPHLRAWLNARLSVAVSLRLSTRASATIETGLGTALSAPLMAQVTAAFDPALKAELKSGLSH